MDMHTRFLEQIREEVGIERSNNQKFCFLERFHPANRQKDNINESNPEKSIKALIEKRINCEFSNIEQYLSGVIRKIDNHYGEKIIEDGFTIPPKKKGRFPSNESPWEEIYKWLWEKEFPRRAWDIAKEIAVDAEKKMQMIPFNLVKVDRGGEPCFDEIPENMEFDDCIKEGEKYRLQINLQETGYLLLILETDTGDKYLYSPSRAFTKLNMNQLSSDSDQPLIFPEIEITYGLKFRSGEINFLALITPNPLELSWVRNVKANDLQLNEARLNEIFTQIAMEGNSQVFTKNWVVNVA